MSGYILLFIILGASSVYLIRQVLIFAGMLKGPLLSLFELYGDDEPFYYPFPGILIALAAFLLAFGFLVEPIISAPFLPAGPGLLMLTAAYFAYRYRDVALRHPHIFQAYPRWLFRLRDYTSREERRRIAYRWLTLPWRTRLYYNSSDSAFLLWADLIVLATIA